MLGLEDWPRVLLCPFQIESSRWAIPTYLALDRSLHMVDGWSVDAAKGRLKARAVLPWPWLHMVCSMQGGWMASQRFK